MWGNVCFVQSFNKGQGDEEQTSLRRNFHESNRPSFLIRFYWSGALSFYFPLLNFTPKKTNEPRAWFLEKRNQFVENSRDTNN